MGPALMRVMKTELEVFEKEAIQKGMEKGRQEGVRKGIQEGMQKGIQEGMQQGIQEGMQQGIQEGMQKGMQKTIEILRDLGYENGKIIKIVKEKYNLTDEEIGKYISEK